MTIQQEYIPLKNHLDLWNDITPIEQFSEKIDILLINYPKDYELLMKYFRGILEKKRDIIKSISINIRNNR